MYLGDLSTLASVVQDRFSGRAVFTMLLLEEAQHSHSGSSRILVFWGSQLLSGVLWTCWSAKRSEQPQRLPTLHVHFTKSSTDWKALQSVCKGDNGNTPGRDISCPSIPSLGCFWNFVSFLELSIWDWHSKPKISSECAYLHSLCDWKFTKSLVKHGEFIGGGGDNTFLCWWREAQLAKTALWGLSILSSVRLRLWAVWFALGFSFFLVSWFCWGFLFASLVNLNIWESEWR